MVYVLNVVKDNVGVVAVLAKHSVNGNKIIELRYVREVRNNVVYAVNVVKDNVGVVAVLATHSVNRNNDIFKSIFSFSRTSKF